MAVLCMFLLAACFFDYRKTVIPNILILVIGMTGIVRACFLQGVMGPFHFLGKTIFIMIILYPFFKIGTLGAGDIKLFGMCAGFFPVKKLFLFLFISMAVAGLFSLLRFVRKKDIKERFSYLFSYLAEVMQSGNWQLYFENEESRKASGICMAGPILCSTLLFLGGAY